MRLIDADKIPYSIYFLINYRTIMAVRKDDIDQLPTLDVVPVVHAHWIGEREEILCSKCKVFFSCYVNPTEDRSLTERPKYCPNCGAKMDEVDDG